MNTTLANEILKVAAEGGYEVPEVQTDDELLEQGDFYLRHAEAAVSAGSDDETILRIVKLASAESESFLGKESDNSPKEANHRAHIEEPDSAPARLAKANNLPIPPEIQGEAHVLPRDLTSLSDRDVRKLSGEYNAVLARTNWLLGVAQSDLANFSHLRDDEYGKEFTMIKMDATTNGFKFLKDEIEFLAKQKPAVRHWEEQVREAEEKVRTLKILSDIYRTNCDRLSREWTMRQDGNR